MRDFSPNVIIPTLCSKHVLSYMAHVSFEQAVRTCRNDSNMAFDTYDDVQNQDPRQGFELFMTFERCVLNIMFCYLLPKCHSNTPFEHVAKTGPEMESTAPLKEVP